MGANAQTSVPAFTAGQVLTAAQVTQINTGIPVFASSTERDAAFGGTGEKTLAEGQMAYLEDTNATQYYDGSSWAAVAGGKILQVVSTTKTDTFSSAQTAGGTVDVTGLSVTITPSSASSTILLYGSVHGSNSTGPANNVAWFFQRGSTAIGIGDAASTRSRITAAQYGAGFAGLAIGNASMLIEDSPATTSATTYKITLLCMSGGTLYVNRTGTDTDSAAFPRTVSSIIALEVSA